MVAAKEVTMEPTIKSLNDDLVRWRNKVTTVSWFGCTFNLKHRLVTERSSEGVWGKTQAGCRESQRNGLGRVSVRFPEGGLLCHTWYSNHICRYKIRGDDEEWEEVLKKAGSTAVVSIKRCGAVKGSSFYLFYRCLTVASLPTVTRRGSWMEEIPQRAMEPPRMGSWRRKKCNTASWRKTRTNAASLERNCNGSTDGTMHEHKTASQIVWLQIYSVSSYVDENHRRDRQKGNFLYYASLRFVKGCYKTKVCDCD